MTPSATAMLIDDIDQPEASETVRFGLDDTAYEIDLPARHASELRAMIGRYISVARRNGQLRHGLGGSTSLGRAPRWTGSSTG